MRTRSPLKARACSPLMARTYGPLKVIGTSTQGSTFTRKQEIGSSRGPVIQKDWTRDVENLCS